MEKLRLTAAAAPSIIAPVPLPFDLDDPAEIRPQQPFPFRIKATTLSC
jgi:hypothetical protein